MNLPSTLIALLISLRPYLECLTEGPQWRAADAGLLPAGRLQPARPPRVRGGAARVRRLPHRRRLEHRRRQLRGHPRPRHEVPVGRAKAGEPSVMSIITKVSRYPRDLDYHLAVNSVKRNENIFHFL